MTVAALTPTTRDDLIRSDLARGVPPSALSEEWGIPRSRVVAIGAGLPSPPELPAAAEDNANKLTIRTSGGRIINPYADDMPDPDDVRDPRAAGYHRERLTPSTRRKYRYYIGRYLDFCAYTGRCEVPGNRFTAEAFAISLAEQPITKGKNKGKKGQSPASIGVALAAVRALHVAMGENPPDRELARGIVESHTKTRAKDRTIHDGVGSPAVDLPTFASLVEACPATTNAGLRDRALLTLGLNIMARRSEACILDIDDITIEADGWMSVYIHETKSGKPRTVKVPAWDDMPELCPIRAWKAWKSRLAEHGVTTGAAFRAVDQWDNIQGAGPWAGRAELGSRLAGWVVEHIIARAAIRAVNARAAEMSPEEVSAAMARAAEMSPHGVLRRTGATLAYAGGADILAIAEQGGWAKNSPVVFRYISVVDLKTRNPMLKIVKAA